MKYITRELERKFLSMSSVFKAVMVTGARQVGKSTMLKKLAESICQPVSYNRLSHVLSSVSGKITMPTVSKYIECCEQAWLLMRLGTCLRCLLFANMKNV